MALAHLVAESMKRPKYGNRTVEFAGHKFASQKEGHRFIYLRDREQKGEIQNLTVHPRFQLIVNGYRIGAYTADFQYLEGGRVVVEDVKSTATRTEAYGLRKKLMWACHGIKILET